MCGCSGKSKRSKYPASSIPQTEPAPEPQPEPQPENPTPKAPTITGERLLDGTTRINFSNESLLVFYAMARLGKALLDGNTQHLFDTLALSSFIRSTFADTETLHDAMETVGQLAQDALQSDAKLDEQFNAVTHSLVAASDAITANEPESIDSFLDSIIGLG